MSADEPVAVRRIRLTYADTDAAAILYFAAWFPWMERISVEWVYGQGFRFDQIGERFGAAPSARATSCEYTAPARVYDEIDVAMRIEHIGTTSYRLGFTMTRCVDRVVVARSTLTLVFIAANGVAAPLPVEYRTMLETAQRNASPVTRL
jgi:acyl-CoA thioester hydrolase